jgi:hypothetical protein
MALTGYEGLEVTAISNDVSVENDTPGKAVCPDCDKLFTVTAAGEIRKHKCVNDINTGGSTASHGSKAKRPRTPLSVRNFGVAIIGAGVEYGAAATVAQWADCSPSEVPTDLGENADIMIGPVLDALWPRLPKNAQRVIKNLADESDLLLSAMAWWEWGSTLKKWGDNHIAATEAQKEQVPTRGYQDNGIVQESFNGLGNAGPLQPFTPNPAGDPPM